MSFANAAPPARRFRPVTTPSTPTAPRSACRRSCSKRWSKSSVGTDVMVRQRVRSEEHTSELQSLMRISYAVFCLKKKTNQSNMNEYDNVSTDNNNHTILHPYLK